MHLLSMQNAVKDRNERGCEREILSLNKEKATIINISSPVKKLPRRKNCAGYAYVSGVFACAFITYIYTKYINFDNNIKTGIIIGFAVLLIFILKKDFLFLFSSINEL